MNDELIALINSETDLNVSIHTEDGLWVWASGDIECERGFSTFEEALVDAIKILLYKIPDVDFDEDLSNSL